MSQPDSTPILLLIHSEFMILGLLMAEFLMYMKIDITAKKMDEEGYLLIHLRYSNEPKHFFKSS